MVLTWEVDISQSVRQKPNETIEKVAEFKKAAKFFLSLLNQWRDFFVDLFTTALEPDGLLVEVVLPAMARRSGYAFKEVSRRLGDYALVGAVATVHLDRQDRCRQAHLVFFSVGNGPVEARQAVELLKGQALSSDAIRAAAETAAAKDIDPPGDIHASPAFRRHLARVLATEVLEKAAERARTNR